MAKKNSTNPYLLAAIALFLLVGGWLMKSFPLFLLVGYAPLFTLTDSLSDKKPFWNQFEFILVALGVSFFAAHIFQPERIIMSSIQAIVMTLPFVAYGFTYQSLGARTIKFTILFFWLAIEFIVLKSPWRESWVYLADGFSLFSDWLTFTGPAGYLSITAWILLCNLLAYQAYFKDLTINFYFAAALLVCLCAPIGAKYLLDSEPLMRDQMMALYQGQETANEKYNDRGEWMARTGTWVSVLILLLSLVKYKTRKK